MSAVVHAFRPGLVETLLDIPYRETVCGRVEGRVVEGGVKPFFTMRDVTVRAVDFGAVTCGLCLRSLRKGPSS